MNFLRLGINSTKFAKIHVISTRPLFSTGVIKSNKSTKKIDVDEDEDEVSNKPYSYMNSEAAQWQSKWSRHKETDAPWYQNYVISGSVGIFLLYFCVLREENDVDSKFNRDLRDHLPHLTEQQFNMAISTTKVMKSED